MKKEASLEQWRELYNICNQIHELEPWEELWDTELFQITTPEGFVFYSSVLGMNGECYGISIYEGKEGLNYFNGLLSLDVLGVRPETMMLNSRNIACYWGDREELSSKQRKRIKDLGISYRGRDSWLYFTSFCPGYAPSDLDKDEVAKMIIYMGYFLEAFNIFVTEMPNVDFDVDECFSITFLNDGTHTREIKALPELQYQIKTVVLDSLPFIDELRNQPRVGAILEINERTGKSVIKDKEPDRPTQVRIIVIADVDAGMIIDVNVQTPENAWPTTYLEALCKFIINEGIPEEIHVPDHVAEITLSELCEELGIKLMVAQPMLITDPFFDQAPF